ncbi:MAG: hypothetical protein WBL29_17635 [Burkholderiales bacterium]
MTRARKPRPRVPVVAALRKARELVKRGWCQGASKRGRAHCAWHAVAIGEHYQDATYYLGRAVGTDRTGSCIVDWNDAKDRTKAQVVAAFTKAIALAEELRSRARK